MSKITLFFTFPILVLLLSSCGKKQSEDSPKIRRDTEPQMTDIEVELDKQELFCSSDRFCPSYLTKIAVVNKGKLKFCTGFLTDSNVVATASSCLPDRLRVKDLPCDNDVFFFFLQTNSKPMRVGCKKVLEVSTLDSKEPVLWRSNVTYLELAENFNRRRTLWPSRNGMGDMERFHVWSVDQIDEYQGIIRKSQDCTAVYNSYLNPLSTNQASPVITLAGCGSSQGNLGSPVMDYRGNVRGMISEPVDKQAIEEVLSLRILEKPLQSLVHVSNFACAPLLTEEQVLDENECGKTLSIGRYDLLRKEMLNENNIFKNSIQKLKDSVNKGSKYLQLEIELKPTDDIYTADVYPKCFKNVSNWIIELNNTRTFTFSLLIPELKLKKSMNEFGKIFAKETIENEIQTKFQFQPKVLKNSKRANVYMWSEYTPTILFPGLSISCESLF